MYILVYDTLFNQNGIIDVFDSLIWTKRYNDCGDFELSMYITSIIPDFIKAGNYVSLSEDYEHDYFMIIETIELLENSENGDKLTISGRSLESILDRRIIWDSVSYSAKSSWYIIKDLLSKSIISPMITSRKIDDFVIEEPSADMSFSSIYAEYDGDSLLTAIQNNCQEDYYSMSLRRNIQTNQFVFSVYNGEDRSYDQTKNDLLIFSPTFDTMYSSKYLFSTKNYRNAIQVVGQGSTRVSVGETSGLERREHKETVDNISGSNALKTIGRNLLYTYRVDSLLEADSTDILYKYGVNYFVGDIVQLRNSHGIESKARITEVVFSQDESGISIYPTFKTIY